MPQALRELSEQLEVFCEGHNCITPLSVLSSLQIFEYSSPESLLDVSFGSSFEVFTLFEDLQPVAVQVLFLTATFTHTMMTILGEPSLTFSDHRKIPSFDGSRDWLEEIKGERVELGEIPKDREQPVPTQGLQGVLLIPAICSGQTKGMLTEANNRN